MLPERGSYGTVQALRGRQIRRRALLQEFASLGYRCDAIDETHILALPPLA